MFPTISVLTLQSQFILYKCRHRSLLFSRFVRKLVLRQSHIVCLRSDPRNFRTKKMNSTRYNSWSYTRLVMNGWVWSNDYIDHYVGIYFLDIFRFIKKKKKSRGEERRDISSGAPKCKKAISQRHPYKQKDKHLFLKLKKAEMTKKILE